MLFFNTSRTASTALCSEAVAAAAALAVAITTATKTTMITMRATVALALVAEEVEVEVEVEGGNVLWQNPSSSPTLPHCHHCSPPPPACPMPGRNICPSALSARPCARLSWLCQYTSTATLPIIAGGRGRQEWGEDCRCRQLQDDPNPPWGCGGDGMKGATTAGCNARTPPPPR